jgi:hypothetical protein
MASATQAVSLADTKNSRSKARKATLAIGAI